VQVAYASRTATANTAAVSDQRDHRPGPSTCHHRLGNVPDRTSARHCLASGLARYSPGLLERTPDRSAVGPHRSVVRFRYRCLGFQHLDARPKCIESPPCASRHRVRSPLTTELVFPGRSPTTFRRPAHTVFSFPFLVDKLDIRRCGFARTSALVLHASVQPAPLLVGSVGEDFGPYRLCWPDHGVDTGHVRILRSSCTPGPVSSAPRTPTKTRIASSTPARWPSARVELSPIADACRGLDSRTDPGRTIREGMTRHTDDAVKRGYAVSPPTIPAVLARM